MRNVMTMRSKTSSAISTTDSTEEPNHRLHWLPRLDRRVTIVTEGDSEKVLYFSSLKKMLSLATPFLWSGAEGGKKW